MSASWSKNLAATKAKETIITIGPKEGLADACRLMASSGIHHLIVADDTGVLGILSHKHIVENGFTPGLKQINPILRVEEVMKSEFPTLNKESTYQEALRAMIDSNVSIVPIMENDILIGVVTDSDLLKYTDHWLRNDSSSLKAEAMDLAAHPIVQSVMTMANDIGL